MIKSGKKNEAVSPVVGIMLMLTLVIILAAVISGFAGGIAGNSGGSTDIQITAQTNIIVNKGESADSKFEIDILSVNSPVSTKDLKLKTSWKTYDKDENPVSNDTAVTPGSKNFYSNGGGVSPLGSGLGLSEWNRTTNPLPDDINFGNYTLMAGTRMTAYPAENYGESDYGSSGEDSIQAVLGQDWDKLNPGDVVSVMLIHVPSGRVIYDDEIYVNG
ncbi:type IV pilin N-terminal domain-containing protein [Methanomicrobium antiquum]|uniref:Type IV pilin N-terminal domain-containing protein n=1 Tax=Methanomicrobium antiquum TaxID=487686 RepID=A0AAF0FSY2_9EURY|nr:type IV pilin N-terminal domain-containing protein [Methanomicrobium antiquum]WFN37341.1 type IV pilin N-terminal domain-containing protein [Methanomicrobium antiquum]